MLIWYTCNKTQVKDNLRLWHVSILATALLHLMFVKPCTCFSLQPRHYSSQTTPNLQPTANQERKDQCGNQHYGRELLMMGIEMPETCWAYTKYNKIISSIYLVLILQHCYVSNLNLQLLLLFPAVSIL